MISLNNFTFQHGLGGVLAACIIGGADAQTPPAAPPATAPTAQAQPQTQPVPKPQSQPQSQTKPRPIVTIDRVVAVINDEVITRSDLDVRVRRAEQQMRRDGVTPPARNELEKQMLERMITDKALFVFARDNGVRVDDIELGRAIERIAQDNKMVVEQLRVALESEGVPFNRFREDIRTDILKARLRDREVNDRIVVTENEVDGMLNSPQLAGANDEFNLSHILVRVPESASPDQINARQSRAQQVLEQLRKGVDFRQVSAGFSDAPDALQGGSLGWRRAAQLPTVFTDALVSMKPGEVSGLLRSPNGFHVVKLNERRGEQQAVVVRQTRARHILIKVSEVVSDTDGRNRMRTLKERIDNKADFAQLARVHSEDTSSSKGGELGWLSEGDTVPEFDAAMSKLKVNEISDPVRTSFGWHLIQVLERRSADMSNERKRLAVRQAIRERKGEEAFQEWVRQTRDRAYVETRLE